MRHISTILASLVTLLALAACGGGGGEAGDINIQDGPVIQSIVPAPNADDVDLGTLVEFVFEEPLDPTSVGPAQVRVYERGIAVAGAVSYSGARRAIVFTATQPLPADAILRVKLMPGIRDVEDREREEALEYDFETRLPQAAAPFRLAFEPGKYVNPAEIKVNKQGQGVLVYTLQDFDGPDTRFARVWSATLGLGGLRRLQDAESTGTNTEQGYDIGATSFITAWKTNAHSRPNDALLQTYDMSTGAWSGEISLETTPGHDAGYPDVVRSDAGYMMAIWMQNNFSNDRKDIVTRIYRPGMGWGLRVAIDGSAIDANGPRISMNEAGQTVVTFHRVVGNERQVFARRWDPTDGWASLEPLMPAPRARTLTRHATIAADGSAIAAWTEEVDGKAQLYVRRLDPTAQGGPAWEPRHDLTPADGTLRRFQGFMDAAGNATFVYGYRTNGFLLSQARYVAGQGWSNPTPIGLPAYTTFERWFVEVDDDGMAIMWAGRRDDGDPDTALFSAATGADGRLGAPIRIATLTGDRPSDYWGDVTRTAVGGVAMLWRDVTDLPGGDESLVRFRSVSADGSLGELRTLDLTPGVMHHGLRLDVDAMGRGIFVYSRAEIGETREQMWFGEIR